MPEKAQRILADRNQQFVQLQGRAGIEVELPVGTILMVQAPLVQLRIETELRHGQFSRGRRLVCPPSEFKQVNL